MIKYYDDLDINSFLPCKTPNEWIDVCLKNQDIMLIDHAHCEKKAASSALALIFKNDDKIDLVTKMSKIAREELVHFEQVLRILQKRKIEFKYLSSSRYAKNLLNNVRKNNFNNEKLVDNLIVGAFIEARSCERFQSVSDFLDEELKVFYKGLLESEKRHFTIYLDFAKKYAKEDINPRIDFFRKIEKDLILTLDNEFRFHSGVL